MCEGANSLLFLTDVRCTMQTEEELFKSKVAGDELTDAKRDLQVASHSNLGPL